MSDQSRLMEPAIAAALAAGRAILEVYVGAIDVEMKADRSPLTEADRRAHAAIVEALASTGLPMLSEEGAAIPAATRQAWSRYWLVDPLDGTKEFIRRNGEFTVNIALMERDALPVSSLGASRPIGGVLHAPVLDRLYVAWQGGGAFLAEQASVFAAQGLEALLSRAERLPLHDRRETFTIVASRSHASPETDAYIARQQMTHGAVALTNMGSALKIGLVAEGTADAYPRYAPTMEWDTAAGHAIALEAGRDLIDITTGASMRYNKNELVNNWFIVH